MTGIANIRWVLIVTMFLSASGSLAVHFMFHPPFGNPGGEGWSFTNLVAFVFASLDVVLVTFFFSRKKTAVWAYLLNGLIVIYGIVFMIHYGWAQASFPGTPLFEYFFTPTSPYIIMACTDFLMGYILYNLWFMPSPEKTSPETVS